MNLWIIRTFRRKWYPVSQKQAGRDGYCIYRATFGNHHIGVYDWEQTIEQKLVFDIEMRGITVKRRKVMMWRIASVTRHCRNGSQPRRGGAFCAGGTVAEEVAELLLARFNSPWVRINSASQAQWRGRRMLASSLSGQ